MATAPNKGLIYYALYFAVVSLSNTYNVIIYHIASFLKNIYVSDTSFAKYVNNCLTRMLVDYPPYSDQRDAADQSESSI